MDIELKGLSENSDTDRDEPSKQRKLVHNDSDQQDAPTTKSLLQLIPLAQDTVNATWNDLSEILVQVPPEFAEQRNAIQAALDSLQSVASAFQFRYFQDLGPDLQSMILSFLRSSHNEPCCKRKRLGESTEPVQQSIVMTLKKTSKSMRKLVWRMGWERWKKGIEFSAKMIAKFPDLYGPEVLGDPRIVIPLGYPLVDLGEFMRNISWVQALCLKGQAIADSLRCLPSNVKHLHLEKGVVLPLHIALLPLHLESLSLCLLCKPPFPDLPCTGLQQLEVSHSNYPNQNFSWASWFPQLQLLTKLTFNYYDSIPHEFPLAQLTTLKSLKITQSEAFYPRGKAKLHNPSQLPTSLTELEIKSKFEYDETAILQVCTFLKSVRLEPKWSRDDRM